MSDETVAIEYRIATGKIGSECTDIIEFNREAWESMTDAEKEAEIKEAAFEHVEWSLNEVTQNLNSEKEMNHQLTTELGDLKRAIISNLYDYPCEPKPQGIQRLLDLAQK